MTRRSRASLRVAAPSAALAVTLALAGIGAGPAIASQGSVPAEVRSYVAAGLVEQLTDLYGPGADDTGIAFDESTTGTAIWRVFGWSDAQVAGDHPDDPLVLENQWAVPVSMADSPLGLAVVWINPDTDAPELASFVADPEKATALAAVPDAAYLVHDLPSDGWFALEAGVLAPLVAGSSGLESPTPLADISSLGRGGPAAPAEVSAVPPLPMVIAIIAVLLAIIAAAVVVPSRLARRRAAPPAE